MVGGDSLSRQKNKSSIIIGIALISVVLVAGISIIVFYGNGEEYPTGDFPPNSIRLYEMVYGRLTLKFYDENGTNITVVDEQEEQTITSILSSIGGIRADWYIKSEFESIGFGYPIPRIVDMYGTDLKHQQTPPYLWVEVTPEMGWVEAGDGIYANSSEVDNWDRDTIFFTKTIGIFDKGYTIRRGITFEEDKILVGKTEVIKW